MNNAMNFSSENLGVEFKWISDLSQLKNLKDLDTLRNKTILNEVNIYKAGEDFKGFWRKNDLSFWRSCEDRSGWCLHDEHVHVKQTAYRTALP